MLRDGFHQQGVHADVAPYRPNSLDGGCPFTAGADTGAFIEVPATVAASVKTRSAPASYDDHFSQTRMFWQSMSPVEKDHIVQAYTFELGKVYEQAIKERQLLALAEIDPVLCRQVATGLGLPAPEAQGRPGSLAEVQPSPALSQVGGSWPADGRMVAIVVDVEGGLDGVEEARMALLAQNALPLVVAARGGDLGEGITAQRTFLTGRAVEFDAVLLAGCPAPGPDALPPRDAKAGGTTRLDPRVALLIQEAFRHSKVIGAWGDGVEAVVAAGCSVDDVGVVTADSAAMVLEQAAAAMAGHRAWERFATSG